MANALFDPGREGIIDDTISLTVGVIKTCLMRGYTFNAAHKFMNELVATGTIHLTNAALASKTYTNGVFDAADQALGAVTANANNHVVIIYQASAVTGGSDVAQSAQRVIAFIDTGTNYPIIPNGGDITLAWDNGSNKIFKA